jgi:hypothetical protein
VREQRALAEDRRHDRVGHHAGQDRRDEPVRLEAVAVEDLDGQERGAQRRAEHRRDAGRHAGDQEDALLARADPEQPADRRAERAADLHGGPLAPAHAAGAERGDRGQRLDPDDPRADDAVLVVEGVDHRVAAAAARLRRQPGHQAAQEAAHRRQEQEQPRAERRRVDEVGRERLPLGAQRLVADQVLEQEHLDELERGEEGGAGQAGRQADHRRADQGAADQAQVERRGLGEQERQERAGPPLPHRQPRHPAGPAIP